MQELPWTTCDISWTLAVGFPDHLLWSGKCHLKFMCCLLLTAEVGRRRRVTNSARPAHSHGRELWKTQDETSFTCLQGRFFYTGLQTTVEVGEETFEIMESTLHAVFAQVHLNFYFWFLSFSYFQFLSLISELFCGRKETQVEVQARECSCSLERIFPNVICCLLFIGVGVSTSQGSFWYYFCSYCKTLFFTLAFIYPKCNQCIHSLCNFLWRFLSFITRLYETLFEQEL